MPLRTKSLKELKKNGDRLKDKLLNHNEDEGGTNAIITGEKGSGKTTLLVIFLLNLYAKGEICIWRGRTIPQFHYIPDWEKRVIIFIHEKDEIEIYKVYRDKKPEKVEGVQIRKYKSAKHLVQEISKLGPKYIYIVYEPRHYRFSKWFKEEIIKEELGITKQKLKKLGKEQPKYFWYEFSYWLVHRFDQFTFYSLFIDEAGDLFPKYLAGLDYYLVPWFTNQLKDMRKTNISMYMTTHIFKDINSMIRDRIQAKIYLLGAKVDEDTLIKKKEFPLWLNKGTAIIDWNYFGLIQFDKIQKPEYRLLVKIKAKPRKGGKNGEEIQVLGEKR